MSEQAKKVNINTLASNIRSKTVSDSHEEQLLNKAEAVAAEIKDELTAVWGYFVLGWLIGEVTDLDRLEAIVEEWIDERGAEVELEKKDFGKVERQEFFTKIREYLENRLKQ